MQLEVSVRFGSQNQSLTWNTAVFSRQISLHRFHLHFGVLASSSGGHVPIWIMICYNYRDIALRKGTHQYNLINCRTQSRNDQMVNKQNDRLCIWDPTQILTLNWNNICRQRSQGVFPRIKTVQNSLCAMLWDKFKLVYKMLRLVCSRLRQN